MDTGALKIFAQTARRQLLEQVAARMEQVLQTDSVEIREKEMAVNVLKEQIKKSSKEAVVDQVAYTWFNRFCALRYMDVNHYTRIGIVSPQEGFTQPEILQEAKQGVIDDSFKVDKQIVVGLLTGQLPSSNPQQEAYRLLLVGACNAYHAQMPFLFPQIDDYTELLMPDDLLSENSVLQGVRETLTKETCNDVEVVGWMYQYYISERKDEVIAALKKNKKIEAEDIPAATQLFTPHWIVRYLVENSLGRLWMLNHPDSKLVEQMDYYIQSKQPETDYLKIQSPEEIKVCDPACGSGHMLTYGFDLLYAIYKEQGFDPVQIPSLILQNNLFGIEIDQRAGHLAAFALMMKGREKDRRFFRRKIEPNICVLENITFASNEIETYKKAVGSDLFTQELWFLLRQFEQAENFGSLIRPQVKNPQQILERLHELGVFDNMFLHITNEKVKQVLRFTKYLNPRYQVVVANPPYMGSRGMNDNLKDFAKDQYPDSKADKFAMFIERGFELVRKEGYNAMVTMQSWMFLSSYEKLRKRLLKNVTITCMVHMDNMVMGIAFGTAATVWNKHYKKNYKGHFSFVKYEDITKENIPNEFPLNNDRLAHVSAKDFQKVPGLPIAYWIKDSARAVFEFPPLSAQFKSGGRCKTHKDEKYLRNTWEVNANSIGINNDWCILYKGGPFRKYYGNRDHVIKWTREAKEHYKSFGGLTNKKYWDKSGITWTIVTSKNNTAFRLKDIDGQYSSVSPTVFNNSNHNNAILSLLNSVIGNYLLRVLNPTLALNVGNVMNFPISDALDIDTLSYITEKLITISKKDWLTSETSLGFLKHQLVETQHQSSTIEESYTALKANRNKQISEYKLLEEDVNKMCIKAYFLQDVLSTESPLENISLSFNPRYRYVGNKTEEELEAMLVADTMKEFINYAVGCMLGRYSLDKEGLILANTGETLEDYLCQVPEPSFIPDEDNAIPVLEGEWFEDDIAERFKDFLKATFGKEDFDKNLTFLEEAIGRGIREYFVKDFYKEHIKMYKKRPIYWLFSSPKGSFNTLIYMHRYNKHTLSVILNGYLVQYRTKLSARKAMLENRSISAKASQGEKTKALKEIDQINSILSELREYEDEILYPLATQQIEINLDDGVKANYKKFGKALKKISGLSN